MRTTLLIGGIVVIVVILGFVFLVGSGGSPSTTATTSTPGLPVAGSAPSQSQGSTGSGSAIVSPTPTMKVAARGTGAPITTNDFINNGATILDPSNEGNYYLTGSSTGDFAISYDAAKQFFTISLDKEPIGNVRLEAEQYLLNALGISQSQLCNINYYLGTTDSVNSLYAGENLGFSFCPGAIQLPN